MPARVFRYLMMNRVDGHTLKRGLHHRCHGFWTSDEWEPAETVPFGAPPRGFRPSPAAC